MRTPPSATFRKTTSDDEATVETVSSTSTGLHPPFINSGKGFNDDDCSVSTSLTSISPRTRSVVIQRGVHFSLESNQTFFVECLDEMDERDIFETWYENRDYQAIKARLIPLIKKMMRGQEIKEDDTQTIRGLEIRTRAAAKARELRKAEAFDAVMEEQHRQMLNKDRDPDHISQVYITFSSKCLQKARSVGEKDEEAIREDLERCRKDLQDYQKRMNTSCTSKQTLTPESKRTRNVRFGKRIVSQQALVQV